MSMIRKTRREYFGGIVYSEMPGCTLFVDHKAADRLKMERCRALPEGMLSAPLDVHIALTRRCNLRCHGCYVEKEEGASADMPLPLAKSIIDRLSAMKVFTIAFGGGEPLLHQHLFGIARYAREREIVPNITTNGRLIDEGNVSRFKVFGNVHLSFHGPEDVSALKRSVGYLRSAGIVPGLNCLVSSETFDHLPELMSWCAKEKITQVLFLKFKLTRHNQSACALVPRDEQELAVLSTMKRWARRCGIVPMLDCSFYEAISRSGFPQDLLDYYDMNGCMGAASYVAITPEGEIMPCSFCEERCGRALDFDTHMWINNLDLRAFRMKRKLESTRDACRFIDRCNGGCRVCAGSRCVQTATE